MVERWGFGYVEGTRRRSVAVEGWLGGGRCPSKWDMSVTVGYLPATYIKNISL